MPRRNLLFPTAVDPARVINQDYDFDNGEMADVDTQIRALQAYALSNSALVQKVRSVTTSQTLALTDQYISVGTLSAAITLTMPASPVIGWPYEIADDMGSASAHNITINGGGLNLLGASTLVLNRSYAQVRLRFTGSVWSVA